MSDFNQLSSTNWYYAQDGNSIGPVPFASLQALHADGQITDETFVVEEGGQDWKPYGSLALSAPEHSAAHLPQTPGVDAGENKNTAPALPASEKKQPTFRDSLVGCLSLLIIACFVAMVLDKCSSSKDSSTESVEGRILVLQGDATLAQPYELIGPMAGGPGKTIWIVSPTAETPEQRAATVYVAATKLKTTTEGDFAVLLAIDRDLVGPIPNATHGLYTARASFKKQKFVNGEWRSIQHIEVFASTQPRTRQSVDVLRAIYNAATSRNLTWEQDYVSFIAEEEGISEEAAETKVRKAIQLGTPGQAYDFSGRTSQNRSHGEASQTQAIATSTLEERGKPKLLRKDINCLATKEAAMAIADALAIKHDSETEERAALRSFRLTQEARGVRFYPTSNVVVFPLPKTAERGFIEVIVESPHDLPQSRFWVGEDNLEDDRSLAGSIALKGYAFMEGVNGIEIGNTPVATLEDMLKAVYIGDTTPEEASQYAFRTFGALGDYRFVQVSGDFLIYSFGVPTRKTWDAALPYDSEYVNKRRGKLSVDAYFTQLKDMKSGPIQAKNAVRIVGLHEFSTVGGLVKQLPLLECFDPQLSD